MAQIIRDITVQENLSSQTLVFIDANVADYQQLVQGAISGMEVVVLDTHSDGVEKITKILEQRSNIASIHIVSHGSPGCLYLGSSQLSLDTLDDYAQQLKSWFSPSILLYGCNVAAGDGGTEFVEKLHQITGAAIAASTQRTGNAALGGNWELEVTVGHIEPQLAFKPQLMANYSSVLAEFTVTNTNDNGDGSLRKAIEDANNNPGADVIKFAGGTFTDGAPDIITLTTGELAISDSLTIEGVGADQLAISGNNSFRVFNIDDGEGDGADTLVTIQDVTIRNGRVTNDAGAGIVNLEQLTIKNSVITNNEVAGNNGNARVGGGIANNGELRVENSSITNNKSVRDSGGIQNQEGIVELISSTISGNEAGDDGGGISTVGGSVEIINSTISGNKAGIADRNNAQGGGIFNRRGQVSVKNSTITNNEAPVDLGSGIANSTNQATTIVFSSIIAGNVNTDIDRDAGNSTITSNGNNLVGDGNAAESFNANGDQPGIDNPQLDPLANNGGATQTHALQDNSPAIDQGAADGDTPATDQRGANRTLGAQTDVGAFESGATTTAPEITVEGNGVAIADGDDTPDLADSTDFGTNPVDTNVSKTFTVKNEGSADLNLSDLSVTDDFQLVSNFAATTVAPGESATFAVEIIDVTTAGEKSGSITITSNDADEGEFNFDLKATVGDGNGSGDTSTTIGKLANNFFELQGTAGQGVNLKFEFQQRDATFTNEVAAFKVDDVNGTINGLSPGDQGYLDQALQRAKVIFSAPGTTSDTTNTTRVLGDFQAGEQLGFLIVSNGSVASVLNGTTSQDRVFLGSTNAQVSDLANNEFQVGFEDGTDNDNNDLVLNFGTTTDEPALGSSQQGTSEILDFTSLVGKSVQLDYTVTSEAAFSNKGGLYRINNAAGAVTDPGTGQVLQPGDDGYAAAALQQTVLEFDTSGTNSFAVDGSALYGTYILANGDNSQAIFTFEQANLNGLDHTRLVGDNKIAFEDTISGGDFDYDDFVVTYTAQEVVV